jgi:hypothetical protein
MSRRAAELIIFDYIETFYNPTRRHSSLGYLSPVALSKSKSGLNRGLLFRGKPNHEILPAPS